MEIFAKLKYLRISPKKIRPILDVIRGMSAEEARNQLNFIPKRASRHILKLLDSAIANAENNFNLKKENLYIKKITADEGPCLKRWMPRALGRATPIKKRSSHINIVLEDGHISKLFKEDKLVKKEIDKDFKEIEELKSKRSFSAEAGEKGLKEGQKVAKDFNIQREGEHKGYLSKTKKVNQKGFLKRVFRRKSV